VQRRKQALDRGAHSEVPSGPEECRLHPKDGYACISLHVPSVRGSVPGLWPRSTIAPDEPVKGHSGFVVQPTGAGGTRQSWPRSLKTSKRDWPTPVSNRSGRRSPRAARSGLPASHHGCASTPTC
jgi:hypothetical protein